MDFFYILGKLAFQWYKITKLKTMLSLVYGILDVIGNKTYCKM